MKVYLVRDPHIGIVSIHRTPEGAHKRAREKDAADSPPRKGVCDWAHYYEEYGVEE